MTHFPSRFSRGPKKKESKKKFARRVFLLKKRWPFFLGAAGGGERERGDFTMKKSSPFWLCVRFCCSPKRGIFARARNSSLTCLIRRISLWGGAGFVLSDFFFLQKPPLFKTAMERFWVPGRGGRLLLAEQKEWCAPATNLVGSASGHVPWRWSWNKQAGSSVHGVGNTTRHLA